MRSNVVFAIASRQLAIESREAAPTTIHSSALRTLSDPERSIVRGYIKAMRMLSEGVKK